MPTVTVVYTGRCEAVATADGVYTFPRATPVEVPAEIAAALGGDFQIQIPGKTPDKVGGNG